ncbi:MAG: hypothetical protein RMK29_11360 [Myxococcales bacterium]|nr:hypothetical protein [Myxococcota bacterium]MDW8282305.1 hypothetical protein [Myxococcales bacterium]
MWPRRAVRLGVLAAVLGALEPTAAWAQVRVCGNQAALGDFRPELCPVMRDDGVPPDEVMGDGVFTLEVRLQPTELLKYKILPSGRYGPDEVRQVGDCGLDGRRDNPTGDLLVPRPDVSMPVRFFYDSRSRTAGDTLMTVSPPGTAWVAVGGFQERPFDPVQGALDLRPTPDGTLVGSTVVTRDLPPGWPWKVLEKKGTYDGARKYGTDGWSVTPCDSQNVLQTPPVPAGSRLELHFVARLGRLDTKVLPAVGTDGGDTADLRPGDGPGDGPSGGQDGAAADLLDPAALPGIRCGCRIGGVPSSPPSLLYLGAGAGLLLRQRRRARH